MNEKGVSAALLVVPVVSTVYDENKVSMNQTVAIRLILDKAATVDEAVELLGQYNVYFSNNLKSHILIGDAEGNSVIAEYYDGALQAVTSAEDYQIAANHIAYNNENIFESPDSLTRQEAVEQVITDSGNRLDMQTCQELLNAVGLYNRDKSDRLQWSVVYDLTDRSGRIWPRRDSSASWDFTVSEK
jgi:choloylglycine hydrolase